MEIWIKIWTWVLVLNLVIFAGLAVVVTIGGFGNILSMLKSIRMQNDQQNPPEQEE
ncbi:MAG: hypothetical protein JW818_13425 [Pirellulales bacterium]|nr:hypothetical protein [Pirellulales bacterium]